MSDNEKVVHLNLVKDGPKKDDENVEELMREHEAMIESLMEDGPFEYMMGVARRRDGKFMTFGTSMDIRDYVFCVEFLKVTSSSLLLAAFDDV